MIISHNALINALNDYSAFGVVLFFFFSSGNTVLAINIVPRLRYNKF